MERTAASIAKSPNPQQLEMRILANHGSDPRFAFLRGRWKQSWALIKSPPPRTITSASKSLSGMADYDEDSEDSEDDKAVDSPTLHYPDEPTIVTHSPETSKDGHQNDSESAPLAQTAVTTDAQAERRARAKLWAAQRHETSGAAS